jgi:hypothetical protein
MCVVVACNIADVHLLFMRRIFGIIFMRDMVASDSIKCFKLDLKIIFKRLRMGLTQGFLLSKQQNRTKSQPACVVAFPT